MLIKENYSLKNLNTFHVDVKAEYFVEIFSAVDIKDFLLGHLFNNSRKLILGGGSNILFTKDFEGVVIKNSVKGIKIINEDSQFVFVEAGSGEIWNDLVRFCVEKNWGGIENLALIPGTVGAAPVQNIGAYGQELMETLVSLTGIYFEDVSERIFKKEDCQFGYRDSIFKTALKNKFIITSIILRLNKNPLPNLNYAALKKEIDNLNKKNITIKDTADAVEKIRKNKLPDPTIIGNAGSFFKNPEVPEDKFKRLQNEFKDIPGYISNGKIKIPAAWLIEKCGWKNRKSDKAGVYHKQPLVLVNFGNANGAEILKLAENIKSDILEKFGILLSEEVNIF